MEGLQGASYPLPQKNFTPPNPPFAIGKGGDEIFPREGVRTFFICFILAVPSWYFGTRANIKIDWYMDQTKNQYQ